MHKMRRAKRKQPKFGAQVAFARVATRASMDWPRRFSGRRERGGSSGDRRPGDQALAVKRGRIRRASDMKELEVGRLHVRELVVEREQKPVVEQEQTLPPRAVNSI